MNRHHVALLLMALSVGLLVPTMAAPVQPPWEDRLSDDIVVQPTEGPNNQYLVQENDGEMAIVVGPGAAGGQGAGLDSSSTYRFDRMFSIRNTGDERGAVWLTDDVDRIQFYRGSRTGDSLEGQANQVELGPGDSVDVGMRVEVTDTGIRSTVRIRAVGAGGSGNSGTSPQTVGGGTASVQEEEEDGADDGDGGGAGDGNGGGAGESTSTPTPTPEAGTGPTTETPTPTPSPTGTPATALLGGLSFVWLVLLAGLAMVFISVGYARSRDWL